MRPSILPANLLRFIARLGLACGLSYAALGNALAEDTLVVTLDQARIVKVPAGTRTLVIGNPMIADVTLLKSRRHDGRHWQGLSARRISSPSMPAVRRSPNRKFSGGGHGQGLVVQRGMDRQSYTCAPRCQPTARLGDDRRLFQRSRRARSRRIMRRRRK